MSLEDQQLLCRYEAHKSEKGFQLVPEKLRPEKRVKHKAYDGINNVFNFGYYLLKWRIHKALIRDKLEPYLGFLHAIQRGRGACNFSGPTSLETFERKMDIGEALSVCR